MPAHSLLHVTLPSGGFDDATPGRARIRRLVGVYNANGTLRGELSYWVGARLGKTHCALCDITHGRVRQRADWVACRSGLPVTFDTYHRDDQPEQIRDAANNQAPVVIADTDRGHVLLLGPDDIAACERSPQRLTEALTRAAETHLLEWP